MKRSPWGTVQGTRTDIPKGIVFVNTAGHGGYKVYPKYNRMIPEYMRNSDGWYEEDCESAIVQVALEDTFKQVWQEQNRPADWVRRVLETSRRIMRDYYPNHYERFFEVTLREGESEVKDKTTFFEQHKDDLIGLTRMGPHKNHHLMYVVKVWRGGVRVDEEGCIVPPRYFLVSKAEYGHRHKFGMIIDTSWHQEINHYVG